MKSRNWKMLWVATAALMMVSLAVTAPAQAADFTFTFDGCDADTVCVTPVLGGTPDSIQWFYSGATYIGSDVATPFDTCFVYTGVTGGAGDSVVMRAFFTPDPDSSRSHFISADYVNPVDDGHTIAENDSVLADVLVNDTLFFIAVDSVVHLNPTENGPFHGTITRVDSVNSFWYVPDAGFNGTDIFAYQIWRCGATPAAGEDTAVVALTIESDGLLAIDSCWYTLQDFCPSGCDDADSGTINIGDSLQVWVRIAAWDWDELAAGWPQADLPGLAGVNLAMDMRADVDSGLFCWPGYAADTAGAPSLWWGVTPGDLDVAEGFYEILFGAQSNVSPFDIATCTSIIQQAIDTQEPVAGSGAPDWYLWSDVNEDGIATTLDTMRFWIDLRNEPFGEICDVYVRVYDFPSIGDTNTYPMYEIAGDNRWARILKVPAGDLDNADGPYTAWFIFTDNACNVDSATTTYDGEIDNSAPICTGLEWIYEGLVDADSNNCYSLGEELRIRVYDTMNTDDITYYVDLFSDTLWRLGLGVGDPADSSHIRVQLDDLGGGWWGVDWPLDMYPLANAIDTASIMDVVPWVYLHAFDDAMNPIDCAGSDSLKLTWTDANPNIYKIDARPPNPVTITSVTTGTTWNGSREDIICFNGWSPDVKQFRLFWDAGTGVMDYTDTLAGLDLDELIDYSPDSLCWSTDGTVTLSACRDYMYSVWTIDSCGNLEALHPEPILAPGETPTPVASLGCESLDSNVIALEWRATDFSIDSFYIYYGRDMMIDYTTPADVVPFVDTGMYYWTTDDPVPPLVLEEGGHYWFTVWTKDTCGGFEETHPDSTDCWADMAPAEVCVFQPDTISCYSTDLSVFVCNKTEGDEDVVSVTARGRLADTSVAADTVPGPWVTLGSATDPAGAECFNVVLSGLDALVGTDTTKTIELVFTTVDAFGKVLTDSAAYVACVFTFDWSTMVPVGSIVMIDSTYQTFQPYCGYDGWEVAGPGHTIDLSVVGGVPPYTIEVFVDDDGATEGTDEIVYEEGVTATDVTYTFDATGFSKGEGTLYVTWTDWCGTVTTDQVKLCVADVIAPCAEITNPVDGKCIRRSRSTQDPVPVFVTVNPDDNCIDVDDVMKIDIQWADCCGDIGPPTITRTLDSTAIDCPELPEGEPDCDTFWVGDPGGLWDSVNCIDTTTSAICWQYFWVTDTIPDTCTWTTIAIADTAVTGAPTVYTTNWWNTEDLAWVTESGTIIYLRAIVWDYNNNSYTTECVMVCVDIDTPPLCISSPDICVVDDVPSIGGTIEIVADLNLALDNVDDLVDVKLWYKLSTDEDLLQAWISAGSGSRATNASEWRWSSFDTSGLIDGVSYDFRVVAQTSWGTYSWDMDGDGDFDNYTFDTAQCDMVTWFIDRSAPQVAFDTVWTLVDGAEIIQPNVSCALSDPRGWLWSQYGQSITVLPYIYPLGEQGDIVRIQYTLYDGMGECTDCECDDGSVGQVDHSDIDTGCDAKVLLIKEGEGVLDAVTLDPTMAPFVEVEDGYQRHVLHVKVWDACGNTTEDCVRWYMLDIDPTEGIVVEPDNDEVFCQDHSNDGGIQITALTLLGEGYDKVTFYYSSDGVNWTAIDDYDASDLTAIWFPHALGLAEGKWYLSVGVVDDAGNSTLPGTYMTQVWFDCATPEVTLTAPVAGAWMGCEIDLRATATSSVNNPIDSVVFYCQMITSPTPVRIGADLYTADGSTFGYNWDPPAHDGPYYMFARAWNRSGIMAQSAMVEVKFDGANPWAVVIEVDGDVNAGDEMNPTVVTAGDVVPISAIARDNLATWGMGAIDNCGVDSVIFYVENAANLKVFGVMMMADPDVDSLYTVTWATAGLPTGNYEAWVEVWDCGCNNGASAKWAVSVVNPIPAGTIAVDEAIDCCDKPTVDGVQGLDINVTPAGNATIDSIVIWRCLEAASDVYDQYLRVGKLTSVINGVWHPEVDFVSTGWAEGLYRLRAAIYTGSATSEDVNADGMFDDFTFNDALLHHMWLNVDRTVTDFTVSHDATLGAGTDLTVTVTPDDACDVNEVCYGLLTMNDVYAEHGCGGLTYAFDPVDSGWVSLDHGIWHGYLHADVYDCVNNAEGSSTELWILDITTAQAMVVTPAWGAAITSDSYTVKARKLSSASAFTKVEFYYEGAAGAVLIGEGTLSGDEYSATWDLTEVPDGNTEVWAVAYVGDAADPNPPKVHVLVAKAPTNIVLNAPIPSFTRTVFDEELTFVGSRVDLCVDRESISSIETVGLDSVVFGYRAGDAPGALPMNPDPDLGWVRINVDRYGSLCVDWFTDSTLLEDPGCTDGRVAVAAWVYDKAGNVNHSNILHVMIDNTAPYSEIHDIDGDETFGDCHVVADANTAVKISGIGIDDRSCAGDDLATNSGAKYLQFFVGECGTGGLSGCVDVVWVIDGSGSMGDDQTSIANNAALFFNALAGVDFRLGVVAYTDIANPVNTNGDFATGGPGVGQFTTDQTAFQTMVTAVGTGGSATENGLTALNNTLDWYPWRPCNQVMILVTDEDADDMGDFGTLHPALVASGAIIHAVIDPADSAGYSELAPQTNGETFDITTSWGANLAAIASQIRAIVSGAGNDAGIIWGQQVTLEDGQTDAFAYWDPSGLPDGEYCAWTVAIDEIGNEYISDQVRICLEDEIPPVGWVAGFGETYDCPTNPCVTDYMIYAQTCDADVAMAQVQRRPEGSTDPTAWTTMGIGTMVAGDSTVWRFDWNPCLLADANYEMRVIMTDENGNSWLNIGDAARAAHPEWTPPVLHVDLDGACGVAIAATSAAQSDVGFEDKTFENLGLVNVDDQVDGNAIGEQHWMLAVYADMYAGLAAEKVLLWQDYSNSAHFMGSFDDSSILDGGTGMFWLAYNDYGAGATTYLTKGDLMVYHVEADLGFPGCVTDGDIGATVCINPGALSAENGVVLFPARFPIHSLAQQHFQAWPNINGTATAIRLTTPIEGFNIGKYATITITYDAAAVAAAGLNASDLTVAWWDGDEWNTTDCMIAGGVIAEGSATFHTCNLNGVYAVVSSGAVCNSGALTVAHLANADNEYHNPLDGKYYTGPKPTIQTIVRSNIEGENGNIDINPNEITVVLDRGTANELVLWANGGNPHNDLYDSDWDHVTGVLTTEWNSGAPPLSDGSHALWVQAFNKTGYCNAYTFAFDVDAGEPDVVVTTDELCMNPTFTVMITDDGVGVNWDSVYVDVYDITGSEFAVVPKSRLIHTETPDAFQNDVEAEFDGTTFNFTLDMHTAQERRLHIVIYDGVRHQEYYEDCNCEYYVYDHDHHGVPDLVGNHTEIVEEMYVVSGPCGAAGEDTEVTMTGDSYNPFNPSAGQVVSFDLNGFSAAGTVTATVYDLTGQRVATLYNGAVGGQVAQVTWAGRTSDGTVVADGVYLVHFQASGGQASPAPTSQVIKVVVRKAD